MNMVEVYLESPNMPFEYLYVVLSALKGSPVFALG